MTIRSQRSSQALRASSLGASDGPASAPRATGGCGVVVDDEHPMMLATTMLARSLAT